MRAKIGQMLRTHTHAAKLVVEMYALNLILFGQYEKAAICGDIHAKRTVEVNMCVF